MRWQPGFLLSLLLIVGAACGETGESGVTHGMAIDYGTGFQFTGVDGLVEMSAEIVVVDAESAKVENIGSVPFTVTDSRVIEVIRSTSGRHINDVIRLRQTG